MPKEKESVAAVKQVKQDTELESKLEKQSKDLWAIKDKLREHVSTAQMRELLSVNNQDSTGSEYDLRERWLVLSCVYYCPYTLVSYSELAVITVVHWSLTMQEPSFSYFQSDFGALRCTYFANYWPWNRTKYGEC